MHLPVFWQRPAPPPCHTAGSLSSEEDRADSCSQALCSHSGGHHWTQSKRPVLLCTVEGESGIFELKLIMKSIWLFEKIVLRKNGIIPHWYLYTWFHFQCSHLGTFHTSRTHQESWCTWPQRNRDWTGSHLMNKFCMSTSSCYLVAEQRIG